MPLPNIKSPEEFEKLIAQDKLIVVDFYDVWCGPCKFLAPKMLFFAKTYPDVVFVRVDVDEVSVSMNEPFNGVKVSYVAFVS